MIRDLDLAGKELVERLGGHWSNGQGVCRCPAHADRTPSLSVRRGRTTLLFKCFAGCTIGDILGALRQQRMAWPVMTLRPHNDVKPARSYELIAARLWEESVPLAGTVAESYLAGRGLNQHAPALRYHRAVPLGSGRQVRFLPALLAAVTHQRRICGVQRTFLDANGQLASICRPKRSLGAIRGGAVMLAPSTSCLGLAEGVESALSASALLGIPVWATLGSACFDKVPIPADVSRLLLLADNDRAGRDAVHRAVVAYTMPGRDLLIAWPPAPHNDWNDVLQAGGKGGWEWVRHAA